MKELVERIKADGQILDGNILKVDGFLNHQIDIHLMKQIGQESIAYIKMKISRRY